MVVGKVRSRSSGNCRRSAHTPKSVEEVRTAQTMEEIVGEVSNEPTMEEIVGGVHCRKSELSEKWVDPLHNRILVSE